jgi:hypothetical protein
MQAILNGAVDEIDSVIQGAKATPERLISMAIARAALVQAHATIALVEQQRAANLLELAKTRDFDVASTVDLDAARKLIAPQEMSG